MRSTAQVELASGTINNRVVYNYDEGNLVGWRTGGLYSLH